MEQHRYMKEKECRGSSIAQWSVGEKLGEGNFGIVYAAYLNLKDTVSF